MKSSAAFALGLWTGAVVVAAVGAFHLRIWERSTGHNPVHLADALQAKDDQILALQQERARLTAEEARLKQTVSDLKTDLSRRASAETRRQTREERFAVPVRRDSWIEDAVARADPGTSPELQDAAIKGDPAALEALALLTDRDAGEALTRVWTSDSASLSTKTRAIQYIAATLEVNPHAEDLLRPVLTSPDVDPSIVRAAFDGLSNPGFNSRLAMSTRTPPPPHFRPDYAMRVRLLDLARSAVVDDRLRDALEQSREAILAQWAAAEPTAPPAQ
jgi:cell division protein FtsB